MKKEIVKKDNFLSDFHLTKLDELIDHTFPWFLQKEQIAGKNDGCWFSHLMYDQDAPQSPKYETIHKIFSNYLNYISLCRITTNLLFKQDNPSISAFHTDCEYLDKTKITTAIFYLNTNNGATEFKDGDRIDSVRNRLIMFPNFTLHRAIGQTDANQRVVFNFNFIK